MMELIIKFGLDILTFGGITLFIYSMYKLPIKDNDKQIAILALVVGFVNFYFKTVVGSSYFFIMQITVFIILITVLRRYPILYSITLGITGFIASSLVDSIVSVGFSQITGKSIDELVANLNTYSLMHIIVFALYIIFSFTLVKLGIGFSFVKKRFSSNYKLSNVNYLWAAALIMAMFIMALLTQPEITNKLNTYIILLVGIIFLTSIWYAYKQNKISLNDRYNRE